jgi:hypothetical protein
MADESGETTFMTYADLIKICLNNPPKNGWTTDEMRKRIKIEDKLEDLKAEDDISLEDAEFDKVVECSKVPWQFKHKDIIAFEDRCSSFGKIGDITLILMKKMLY